MVVQEQMAEPTNVEQAVAELEQIVHEIESGKLGLEMGLERYERGNTLIEYCRKVLQRAEERLK